MMPDTLRNDRLADWLRQNGLVYEQQASAGRKVFICQTSHRNGTFPVLLQSQADWIQISAPVLRLPDLDPSSGGLLKVESAQLTRPMAGFGTTFDDNTVFVSRDELWRDVRAAPVLADRLQFFARGHEYVTRQLLDDRASVWLDSVADVPDLLSVTDVPCWSAAGEQPSREDWSSDAWLQQDSQGSEPCPAIGADDTSSLLPIRLACLTLVVSLPKRGRDDERTQGSLVSAPSHEDLAPARSDVHHDYLTRIADRLNRQLLEARHGDLPRATTDIDSLLEAASDLTIVLSDEADQNCLARKMRGDMDSEHRRRAALVNDAWKIQTTPYRRPARSDEIAEQLRNPEAN